MTTKPPPLPTLPERSSKAGSTRRELPPLPDGSNGTGGAEQVRITCCDVSRPLWSRCFGRATPWLTSLLLHQVLIVVLGLWMISALADGTDSPLAIVDTGHDGLDTELESLLFAVEPPDDDRLPMPDSAAMIDLDRDVSLSGLEDLDAAGSSSERPWSGDGLPAGETGERAETPVGDGKPATVRLRQAGTVEEAVGGVIGEIQGKLAKGDLLVVWLLDASISLEDDRPRVAAQLAAMFRRAALPAGPDAHKLMNAAACFGRNTQQLVGPTAMGGRIVKAVLEVPVDPSGTENVFGAVQWAVGRYGKRWPGNMMIVVWTDESGDDLGNLEATIELCRQRRVSVSVMGPSAMLSHNQGTHVWRNKLTGQTRLLPVKRGPDSAMLERLRLPYWYDTRLPLWGRAAAEGMAAGNPWNPQDPALPAAFVQAVMLSAQLPPWYGGPHLERMASGFGPYALTRLTVETLGTYTIFDQPADRGPFRLDTMEPYQPDYRAVDQIAQDVRERPLRRAIVTAARLVAAEPGVPTPQLVFFGSGTVPLYYSPAAFRNHFKATLKGQQPAVEHNLLLLQKALAMFGPDGTQQEYETEESPRWRAWHDLSRGRLLAMQVRHLEYVFACRALTGKLLSRNTNHVSFFPSPVIRSGVESQQMAEEARRLLQRCLENNPDTPWAYLAQRELDHPLGVDFRQSVVTPPPRRPAVPMIPRRPGGGGRSGGTPKL